MNGENNKIQNNSGEITSNCPICGYFTGSSSVCVRCGAKVDKRISVKAARRLSIIGAFLGIILLWYAAYRKMPPEISIGDITESMNNALVTLSGEVTGLEIQEEKNNLKITLEDDTGKIKLTAFNKLDKFKEQLGENMPSLKDKIKVTGTLSISQDWGATMFLSIPSRIQLVKDYKVKEKPISQITAANEGDIFEIAASIESYDSFTTKKGFTLHKFLLGDSTGKIPMVLYSNEFDGLPDEIKSKITKKWNKFRMRVEVSVYRGEPQVKLIQPHVIKYMGSAGSKKTAPAARAKPVKEENLEQKDASAITAQDIGKSCIVSVKVKQVNLGASGVYLSLVRSDLSLFIDYSDWDRFKGDREITPGVKLVAPVEVVSEYGKPLLKLKYFSRIKVNK